MTLMKDKPLFFRVRPATALAPIMALILAGCGGGTTTPTGKSEGTPATQSSPLAEVSQKSKGKDRLKGIAPGGDIGVRERRDQKLKERAAAKE
jgi:hypothetical protein